MLNFLFIILIGGAIGYFLGRSKYGDSIQDTYDRSKTSVSDSWQKRFGKSQPESDESEDTEEEK
jgi:hypothetical protein